MQVNKEELLKTKEDIIKKYVSNEEKNKMEETIKKEINEIIREFGKVNKEDPIDE